MKVVKALYDSSFAFYQEYKGTGYKQVGISPICIELIYYNPLYISFIKIYRASTSFKPFITLLYGETSWPKKRI